MDFKCLILLLNAHSNLLNEFSIFLFSDSTRYDTQTFSQCADNDVGPKWKETENPSTHFIEYNKSNLSQDTFHNAHHENGGSTTRPISPFVIVKRKKASNDKLEVTKVHTKDATNVENMAAATKDAPRSLNTPHEQFCSIINQKLLEGDLSVMNGQLEHDNIVNHTTKAHVQRDMNVTPKGMGMDLFYHT